MGECTSVRFFYLFAVRHDNAVSGFYSQPGGQGQCDRYLKHKKKNTLLGQQRMNDG